MIDYFYVAKSNMQGCYWRALLTHSLSGNKTEVYDGDVNQQINQVNLAKPIRGKRYKRMKIVFCWQLSLYTKSVYSSLASLRRWLGLKRLIFFELPDTDCSFVWVIFELLLVIVKLKWSRVHKTLVGNRLVCVYCI